MNMNLYLPDDLGAQAKAAKLPFSRMLRAAVEEELKSRAEMQAAVDAAYRDWCGAGWAEDRES